MKLTKIELTKIYGGVSVTGTMMNSFIKGIELVIDLGRSLGSAIRRWSDDCMCSYKTD